MLRSRWYIALLLVAGTATAGLAQDSADLKWKFEKGKTFYQEMTTKTEQKMKVLGQDVTQNQEQTFYFSWTPKEQDPKGNWVIVQKIEGIKMKIDIGGNPISYDSTKDTNANSPLADFFKAIVGSEFTITLSPDYKVVDIKGKDDFLKKLIQTHQNMENILKVVLSDDALKQMADPAFGAIPNKTVKKGESWERTSTLNMGPIGKYENTYKYTYEGADDKEKNLAKIKVDTTLKYLPPDANAASSAGLGFTIKSADLKSSDSNGAILFDTKKGQLVSSNMHLKLSGKLTIDVNGQASDVDLQQTQDTTVKQSDDNPLGPPKK